MHHGKIYGFLQIFPQVNLLNQTASQPTNQLPPEIAQVGPGDRWPGGGLGGVRPARHDPGGADVNRYISQPWMVDEISPW